MSQVGRWLAGHSLFISGQPTSFSPLLAKHFLAVESLLLPGNAALVASHYVATWCGHPERTVQMNQQMNEITARTEAVVFWSRHLTSKRDEVPNVAFRIAAVMIQAVLAPMWFIVAAWSPASVHQCLGTATDLLQQKYAGTASGAPHDFYTPAINKMTVAKQAHAQNGNSLGPDYAAALFITLFVMVHFR